MKERFPVCGGTNDDHLVDCFLRLVIDTLVVVVTVSSSSLFLFFFWVSSITSSVERFVSVRDTLCSDDELNMIVITVIADRNRRKGKRRSERSRVEMGKMRRRQSDQRRRWDSSEICDRVRRHGSMPRTRRRRRGRRGHRGHRGRRAEIGIIEFTGLGSSSRRTVEGEFKSLIFELDESVILVRSTRPGWERGDR